MLHTMSRFRAYYECILYKMRIFSYKFKISEYPKRLEVHDECEQYNCSIFVDCSVLLIFLMFSNVPVFYWLIPMY